MEKYIRIQIDPLGNVSAEGQGMVGKECDRHMKPINDALTGADTQHDHSYKPEANQLVSTSQSHVSLNS